MPGVEEAEVDLDKKTATVKFDSGKTDAQALIKATAQAGFLSRSDDALSRPERAGLYMLNAVFVPMPAG